MIKILFIFLSLLLLFSCVHRANKNVPAEVADLNGDGYLDLLFANGGNYSEPEFSRVFINQGAGNKFNEITREVFADRKFLSRVIKVRDFKPLVNPDSYPSKLKKYESEYLSKTSQISSITSLKIVPNISK